MRCEGYSALNIGEGRPFLYPTSPYPDRHSSDNRRRYRHPCSLHWGRPLEGSSSIHHIRFACNIYLDVNWPNENCARHGDVSLVYLSCITIRGTPCRTKGSSLSPMVTTFDQMGVSGLCRMRRSLSVCSPPGLFISLFIGRIAISDAVTRNPLARDASKLIVTPHVTFVLGNIK